MQSRATGLAPVNSSIHSGDRYEHSHIPRRSYSWFGQHHGICRHPSARSSRRCSNDKTCNRKTPSRTEMQSRPKPGERQMRSNERLISFHFCDTGTAKPGNPGFVFIRNSYPFSYIFNPSARPACSALRQPVIWVAVSRRPYDFIYRTGFWRF